MNTEQICLGICPVENNNDSPTYRIHDHAGTNKSSEVSWCEKDNPLSSMVDNIDRGSKCLNDLENIYDVIQHVETMGSANVGNENALNRMVR